MKILLNIILVFFIAATLKLHSTERKNPKTENLIPPSEEIKEESQKAVEIDPNIKIELSRLGNDFISLLRLNKWNDAEKKILEMQKITKDSLEYNYFKSAYLYSRDDYKNSIRFLNKAIEKNPDHDPSYYLLGMIYGKFRNWERAIYYLEIAASKGTFNPFYHYNLAVAYFLNKNYIAAKASAEKTLELKENYHASKILIIRSLKLLNKKEEALLFCEKLENDKFQSEIFFELYANILFETGKNYSKVTEILINLKNLKMDSKRNLAYSLFMENRLQESLNIYRQIFLTGMESEKDHSIYLQILILSEKYSESESFILNWIKKIPADKEKILILYKNLLEDQDVLKSMYKPIPWR